MKLRNNVDLRQLLLLLLFICGPIAGAEVSNLSTADSDDKLYNITFASTLQSSLHEVKSDDYSLSNELYISPSFSLLNDFKLSTGIAAIKGLTGQREFTLKDGFVALSRSIVKIEDLTISGSVLLTIPLSEQSKDIQHLRTSIKLAPTLNYPLLENLSLVYTPSVRVNFHEFKVALDGRSNTQYSLNHKAAVYYRPLESISLGFAAQYAKSFTYQGNSKDFYAFEQSVTYRATEATSFSLGLAIGKSPLDSNGTSTNIEIFNSRDSSVYAGFTFIY